MSLSQLFVYKIIYFFSLFSGQWINFLFFWHKIFLYLYYMVLHLFIAIPLLAFFPKTWTHLWNLLSTNFLASSSDFTTSSSSYWISHFSTIFFTFIVLFFFPFYFCYSCFPLFDLYYLPHFSGYLIIFTFPILQLISELWWASHSIPKITLHFFS